MDITTLQSTSEYPCAEWEWSESISQIWQKVGCSGNVLFINRESNERLMKPSHNTTNPEHFGKIYSEITV